MLEILVISVMISIWESTVRIVLSESRFYGESLAVCCLKITHQEYLNSAQKTGPCNGPNSKTNSLFHDG